MKIAVSGKGGVGKTTIAGALARYYARIGLKVLAIDADPNANLALTLGMPPDKAERIIPISENADLIEAKTGVRPESYGRVFRLSFRVDDILDNFSYRSPENVGLIVMGTIKSAGQGCTCPANAVIKALLKYLLTKRDEVVIIDMEAGVEHLGRGTTKSIDAMLVVTDSSLKALETAKRICHLTGEMGVKTFFIVGNKISDLDDRIKIERFCEDNMLSVLSLLPFDEKLRMADIEGILPKFDFPVMSEIEVLSNKILALK